MASDRQLRANRLNALKSTGPKTTTGKQASRRNALVHGLTAQHLLLDDEAFEPFEAMRGKLLEEFAPTTTIDVLMVERLAGLLWRLSRSSRFEAALLAWTAHRQVEAEGSIGVVIGRSFFSSHGPSAPQTGRAISDPNDIHRRYHTGRLLEAVVGGEDLLNRLGRYERHLMQQVQQALSALRQQVD